MVFAVFDPSPLTVCINCSCFTFIIIITDRLAHTANTAFIAHTCRPTHRSIFDFSLKPGPHQQQCRSNVVECYNVECCFDIVASGTVQWTTSSTIRQAMSGAALPDFSEGAVASNGLWSVSSVPFTARAYTPQSTAFVCGVLEKKATSKTAVAIHCRSAQSSQLGGARAACENFYDKNCN